MANYKGLSLDQIVLQSTEGVNAAWLGEGIIEQYRLKLESVLRLAEHAGDRRFLPEPRNILASLRFCPPSAVRVVIIGQDPYPSPNDAVGIAFHSPNHRVPRSARALIDSVVQYRHSPSYDGPADFTPWLRQGVLLINATLTVLERESNSHALYWQSFIPMLLHQIPRKSVVVLLGREAGNLRAVVPSQEVVTHCHPVERTGQFLELDVFGNINAALRRLGLAAIDWTLR